MEIKLTQGRIRAVHIEQFAAQHAIEGTYPSWTSSPHILVSQQAEPKLMVLGRATDKDHLERGELLSASPKYKTLDYATPPSVGNGTDVHIGFRASIRNRHPAIMMHTHKNVKPFSAFDITIARAHRDKQNDRTPRVEMLYTPGRNFALVKTDKTEPLPLKDVRYVADKLERRLYREFCDEYQEVLDKTLNISAFDRRELDALMEGVNFQQARYHPLTNFIDYWAGVYAAVRLAKVNKMHFYTSEQNGIYEPCLSLTQLRGLVAKEVSRLVNVSWHILHQFDDHSLAAPANLQIADKTILVA